MLPVLSASKDPRVIFVSSGGMLTEPLLIRDEYENYGNADWSALTSFARSKRQQVVLSEEFARLYPNIRFFSMHPGWCDTPGGEGLNASIPSWNNTLKENLRPASVGSDTINWLAVSNQIRPDQTGKFFLDRGEEIKYLSGAKPTPAFMARGLWNWCLDACGLAPTESEIFELISNIKSMCVPSTHTLGFKSYPNSVTGTEIVTALASKLYLSVPKVIDIAQRLIDQGHLRPLKEGALPELNDSSSSFYAYAFVPSHKQILNMVSEKWISTSLEYMDLSERCSTEGGWEYMGPIHNGRIYAKEAVGRDLRMTKAHMQFKSSMEQVMKVIGDDVINNYKAWNEYFQEGKIVEKIDSEISIHYWQFNMPFLSKRDFLVVRRIHKNDDGSICIATRSIEHGKVPEKKGYIRSRIETHIILVTPGRLPTISDTIPQNPHKDLTEDSCYIISMNLTDIKGWIPSAFVNTSNLSHTERELRAIDKVAFKK
eukprot:TRINITY_DN2042_c0_g1_i2.p1 TRINITY_DN2042_c0_g1~~TRINITY_DN2042_c0_g1_i2.p1  ORF type:complete len:484 (-),score=42.32 TRINITY_DN2042_c0_g1_i2:122-1573(-)